MENTPVPPINNSQGNNIQSSATPVIPPAPQETTTGNKNPFRIPLILVTVIIFLAITGFTVYTYLNNQQELAKIIPQKTQEEESQQASGGFTLDSSVTCARFESLELALQYPEKTCILDLSGQGLTKLPLEIAHLTNINELNLSNNKFDSIPEEIFQLTKLINLDISNNNITTIPAQINTLSNLQILDVSNNDLRTVASEISLPTLGTFNAEGNLNLPESETAKVELFNLASESQGLTQKEYEEAVRTNGQSLR